MRTREYRTRLLFLFALWWAVWDAHKDMGLATLGACLGMLIVAVINWRYQRDFGNEFLESLKVKMASPLGELKLREYRDQPREAGDST